MSVQHRNRHEWLVVLSYLHPGSHSTYTYRMAQIHAFKAMLDYHAHLLLVIILNNDVISPGIIHKYCTCSGIICVLKIQFGESKRKQFDQDSKKNLVFSFSGGKKATVPIFGCGISFRIKNCVCPSCLKECIHTLQSKFLLF